MKQLEYNLRLAPKSHIPHIEGKSAPMTQMTQMCYVKDPKTNQLVEGECLFFDKIGKKEKNDIFKRALLTV